VLKSEQSLSSDHEPSSISNGPAETTKTVDSSSAVGSTSTSAIEATADKGHNESPPHSTDGVESEEKQQPELSLNPSIVEEPKLKTESSESHEAESDSNKRMKV
jgi:hypothetical protein